MLILILITIGLGLGLLICNEVLKEIGGYLYEIELTHLSGVPNLGNGANTKIHLYPDKITFNKLQTIPIERIKATEVWQGKELTEKQKSIIGRSLIGLTIGGGIGAILGGITGVGNKKVEKDVIFFNIIYNNLDGKEISLLFATEFYFAKIYKISKHINEKINYKPKNVQELGKSYEV